MHPTPTYLHSLGLQAERIRQNWVICSWDAAGQPCFAPARLSIDGDPYCRAHAADVAWIVAEERRLFGSGAERGEPSR